MAEESVYDLAMAISISRRGFLAGSALVLGAAEAAAQQGQVLVAEPKTSRLLGEGPPTQHWNFRAADGLPVVRARQGEETNLRFINNLEEDIWVHLYGVRIDASLVTALLPKGPAATLDLSFRPPDAGTFWIGPLLNAAKQREMGLYAMLIVEEANAPFADIPLILDDWKLGEDGVLDRKFADIATAAGEGRQGNWFTVNGMRKPMIALSGAKPPRLRLLNVSNAQTLNLRLKGAEALIIAMDGQPVKPQPLAAAGLSLAPGQRADVVPVAIYDDMTLMADLSADTLEAAFFTNTGILPALPPEFSLAENPWPALDANTLPRTISIILEGGIGGSLRGARSGGATLPLRDLLQRGLAWAINGAAGLQPEPLFEAVPGEIIVLAFDNRTKFDQPIAIDGHVWRLLDADGEIAVDQFWRDTAIIPPGAGASYVFAAGRPGLFTLASLVAERADAGLIGSFRVNTGP